MNRTEAAAALGLRESEVADVEDSPAGPIVATTDGVRYVIVAEDNPDADGDHGVMFLAAPSEGDGSWPIKVYAQPGAAAADSEVVDSEDEGPDADSEVVDTDSPPADGEPVETVSTGGPAEPVDAAPAKGKARGNR